VAIKDGLKLLVSSEENVPIFDTLASVKAYDAATTSLPKAVVEWAGITNGNLYVEAGDGLVRSLVSMNDSTDDLPQSTFDEIALAIEATEHM